MGLRVEAYLGNVVRMLGLSWVSGLARVWKVRLTWYPVVFVYRRSAGKYSGLFKLEIFRNEYTYRLRIGAVLICASLRLAIQAIEYVVGDL